MAEKELCPTCFSELVSDEERKRRIEEDPKHEIYGYSWSDDPVLTPKGLSGEEYKGVTEIKSKHIIELQEARKQQEDDIGMFEEDKTEFTEVKDEVSVDCKHIKELRDSTEKILKADIDIEELTEEERKELLYEYFNFDAEGNKKIPADERYIDKDGWTDPDLSRIVKIKAVHIEDLRHPIPSIHNLYVNTDVVGSWCESGTETCRARKKENIIHMYTQLLAGKLKFKKSLSGEGWANFDLNYTPSHLFHADSNYIYYQSLVNNVQPYIWFADRKLEVDAGLHNIATLGVNDCAVDANTGYIYWINNDIYKYKLYGQRIKVFEISGFRWGERVNVILDKDNYYFYHEASKKIKKINKESNTVVDEYYSDNWWYPHPEDPETPIPRIQDMGVDKDYVYVLWRKIEDITEPHPTLPYDIVVGQNTWIYVDKINKETKEMSTDLIAEFKHPTDYRETAFAIGKHLYMAHTFLPETTQYYYRVEAYDKETLEKISEDTQYAIMPKVGDTLFSWSGKITLTTSEEPIVAQRYKD